jgi:hypothetical protein
MDYPLGRLYDESSLVTERVNNQIVTEAQLLQKAVHSMLSKPARTEFAKLTKELNVTTSLRAGLFAKEE